MGLSAWVGEIVEAVVTTVKGMAITARYGVSQAEETTQQYPEVRREPAERFRGFLENDVAVCIGCSMCAKACPISCIALSTVRGRDKKLHLLSFDIELGRCMYCGLCTEVCPVKSLRHGKGYERASTTRAQLVAHFVTETPDQVRARVGEPPAAAPAKEGEA